MDGHDQGSDEYAVTLKCLFCGATLYSEKETKYSSGDLINCKNCGEKNDYDSLIAVALQKGKESIKKDIQNKLRRMFR